MEIKEEAKKLFDKVKKFDFSKFSWTEACAGPDGKSSAGKLIAFYYGIVLIFGTLLTFGLLILKHTSALVNDQTINTCFAFIGLQMPMALGYLLTNKNLENKKLENENK